MMSPLSKNKMLCDGLLSFIVIKSLFLEAIFQMRLCKSLFTVFFSKKLVFSFLDLLLLLSRFKQGNCKSKTQRILRVLIIEVFPFGIKIELNTRRFFNSNSQKYLHFYFQKLATAICFQPESNNLSL